MNPYRWIRRAVGEQLSQVPVQLVPGYHTTARELLRPREKLLSNTSPLYVYGRWRAILSGLLNPQWFYDNGLDNVWERYPAKQDRQTMLMQCLKNVIALKVPGQVAEFGCFQGHTAVQMLQLMEQLGDDSRLLLFDSFRGMPESAHPGDSYWNEGDMTADQAEVIRRFKRFPKVEVIPGFFKDSLPRHPKLKLKFAHVDADLYTSIKDVDDWLLDRMQPGGMIVYDDYGFESCAGAMNAVDEDMGQRRDYQKFYLPTGQYVAIKLAGNA